ncbi:Hypothetical Protein FCC1311_101732 [Hondaea fermentalgiana]|uniref:Uncharacterized protein n=1 Tax=Hondaea fermentalgiana TaxID=2315210 RepID=A0A2R5GSY3_9STRA|nr:Hypothetical Protein FCC1311_101732 [Hondaea fermentalgiana]|eukprot:GBG33950.1 Hypothetical Protein FCC1311_101732 [Hondaea fermentalgiana]
MSGHGSPPEGLTCKATWEDITEEEGNYCEYLSMPSGQWLPSHFGADTVRHLLKTQFPKYLEDVEKAAKDCAAAVRRLVTKGPPVYLSDAEALPLPEGDTHIEKIWFAADDEEISAKLAGALEGDAREELWASQRETLAMMEAAEAGQT